jgi:predicted SprT family Zn-dependent metalloprotease
MGLAALARRVRVSWNPRMRTTAGRAWWPERAIELNPKLKLIGPEQMWRTLKHELAHLVAYERAGRKRIQVHGAEWEQACRDLGIAGEKPFHELPFRRRRMRKRFAYICPECWSTIERVKKIPQAVACWDCCRKFSRGKFDSRFRLVEKRLG